jgi:hypothetical protein
MSGRAHGIRRDQLRPPRCVGRRARGKPHRVLEEGRQVFDVNPQRDGGRPRSRRQRGSTVAGQHVPWRGSGARYGVGRERWPLGRDRPCGGMTRRHRRRGWGGRHRWARLTRAKRRRSGSQRLDWRRAVGCACACTRGCAARRGFVSARAHVGVGLPTGSAAATSATAPSTGNPARPTARRHQASLAIKKGGTFGTPRGVHAGTAQPSTCAGARGCAVAARWHGAQGKRNCEKED